MVFIRDLICDFCNKPIRRYKKFWVSKSKIPYLSLTLKRNKNSYEYDKSKSFHFCMGCAKDKLLKILDIEKSWFAIKQKQGKR